MARVIILTHIAGHTASLDNQKCSHPPLAIYG